MLVEVVQLRRQGRKLTSEEVGQAQRYRGHIEIEISGRATLWHSPGPGGPTVLPGLSSVTLYRWRGADIMLRGQEYIMGSGVPGRFWPQAWWVRLLTSPPQ